MRLCIVFFYSLIYLLHADFDSTLKVEEIIEGDRIASRFGHEVKLIDVTGDGYVLWHYHM